MEQNLMSDSIGDQELLKRIRKVLEESQGSGDVEVEWKGGEGKGGEGQEGTEPTDCGESLQEQNLLLTSQLEVEKRKSLELESRFELLESSVRSLEQGHKNVGEAKEEDMGKPKQKPAHSSVLEPAESNDDVEDTSTLFKNSKDFAELEAGMEINKDDDEYEMEKVYITKTEKKCLEDIGQLAAYTRVPLDEKHQSYFEKDRKKFANKIMLPETQELTGPDPLPKAIQNKVRPVSITSTELDGLRSYLLQLKELIARRETAWAKTTERDYNQRVEITRFKNEVSHLRMLCEKRQRDVKDRDQVITAKEEEITELQKRIQALRYTLLKLEKKDGRLMESLDGLTNEVLENSQAVQKSYKEMKKDSPGGKKEKSKKTPKQNKSNMSSNEEESKTKISKKKDTIDKVDEKLQKIEQMLENEVAKGSKKSSANAWKQGTNFKNAATNDLKTLIRNHNMDTGLEKKMPTSNSKMRQEMMTAMVGMNPSVKMPGMPPMSMPIPGMAGVPGMGAIPGMGGIHSMGNMKGTTHAAAMLANALFTSRNVSSV